MVDNSPRYNEVVTDATAGFGIVAASDQALAYAGDLAAKMGGQRLAGVVPAAEHELGIGGAKPAAGLHV